MSSVAAQLPQCSSAEASCKGIPAIAANLVSVYHEHRTPGNSSQKAVQVTIKYRLQQSQVLSICWPKRTCVGSEQTWTQDLMSACVPERAASVDG